MAIPGRPAAKSEKTVAVTQNIAIAMPNQIPRNHVPIAIGAR